MMIIRVSQTRLAVTTMSMLMQSGQQQKARSYVMLFVVMSESSAQHPIGSWNESQVASKQTPNMRHRSSHRIDEVHQVRTPLLRCNHALAATSLRYCSCNLLRAQWCGSPWPLGRREQASNKSRGYPQAQAIYDGPHPGAHRESPLLGHHCRKHLLQE